MRTPFAAHAIEELTDAGFVRRTASEWTYYAPDAPAHLSDPFLDTHCFRLAAGGPERAGLIGLAFEPTGENEDVPDVSGTLWLDRDSVVNESQLATVDKGWIEERIAHLPSDVMAEVDYGLALVLGFGTG